MGWNDEPPPHGEESAPRKRRAPRAFKHSHGVREGQRAFISLTAPSGGGKTKTALELAQGLCSITGPITGRSTIFVVDTENGRAKKYAPRPGEQASPMEARPEGKTYAFEHVPFEPPFDPDSYLDALHYCEEAGAGCVIFDSMSHEHAGEGGRLDSHDKIAGDNAKKNFAAWRPNSDARNRLLWGGFFRSPCHIILCFRAKDKSEQRGTKIIDAGFTPIGGADFIFEADCSLLFMPQASGVPTWRSELRGEQSAIKLPDEYRAIFREGEQVSWRHGQEMARWLNAGAEPKKSAPPPPPPPPASNGDASRVAYAGREYGAGEPVAIETEVPIGMMSKKEQTEWAGALAALLKASDAKRAWLEANDERVRALAPALQNRLRELAGAAAPA